MATYLRSKPKKANDNDAAKKISRTSKKFEDLCIKLEHWETDPWAAAAILKNEILTAIVIDPCAGTGILSEAARAEGYTVIPCDIHDWGYPGTIIRDWLDKTPSPELESIKDMVKGNTVFMNPPYKRAQEFVERAFELGARKVICFQRFSWYEGSDEGGKFRGVFWEKFRPCRIWVCGDRATCWLHSVPVSKRKKAGGTTYTNAFYVWERGHAAAAQTKHIFRSDLAV